MKSFGLVTKMTSFSISVIFRYSPPCLFGREKEKDDREKERKVKVKEREKKMTSFVTNQNAFIGHQPEK
jgi:hypothetical protein